MKIILRLASKDSKAITGSSPYRFRTRAEAKNTLCVWLATREEEEEGEGEVEEKQKRKEDLGKTGHTLTSGVPIPLRRRLGTSDAKNPKAAPPRS